MKRKRSGLFVLIALLFLGIGFATLSTNLYINGEIKTDADEENFYNNVIFTYVWFDDDNDEYDENSAEISADGKTITFSTRALSTLGETITVNYTVKNNSIFDADIGDLYCEVKSDESNINDSYVKLTAKNEMEDLEHGGGSGDDSIEIKLIRSYAEESMSGDKEVTYACSLVSYAKWNH